MVCLGGCSADGYEDNPRNNNHTDNELNYLHKPHPSFGGLGFDRLPFSTKALADNYIEFLSRLQAAFFVGEKYAVEKLSS